MFRDIKDNNMAVIRIFRIPRERKIPQYNVLRVNFVPCRKDCGLMYHAAAAETIPSAVAVIPVFESIPAMMCEDKLDPVGLLSDILTRLRQNVHAMRKFFILVI